MTTANLPIACFTERYSAWDYQAHFRAARGIAYNFEPCPDSDGSLAHSFDSIMTFFAGSAQTSKAFSVGRHQTVFDAVVDHLRKTAREAVPQCQPLDACHSEDSIDIILPDVYGQDSKDEAESLASRLLSFDA